MNKLEEETGKLALINILSNLETTLLTLETTFETYKGYTVETAIGLQDIPTGKIRVVLELYRSEKT